MCFMRNTRIKVAFKLAVSAGLITYLFYTLDWKQVANLDIITLAILPVGLLIGLFFLTFMAARWKILVEMQSIENFTFAEAYRGYLIGCFFNIFMPGAIGGDLLRIKYCLNSCKIGIKKAGLVVITERVFGLAALAILFSIGVSIGSDSFSILELEWISIALGISISMLSISALIFWLSRHIHIKSQYLLLLLFLSAAGQMTDIIIVYIVLLTSSTPLPFMTLLFVMPLVYIATVLPISIGGLGVREGVLSGLLVLFGVEYSTAIITSFMIYFVKVLIGLVGLPVYLRIRNENLIVHNSHSV